MDLIDEFICRVDIEAESEEEIDFTVRGLSCSLKSVNESVELAIEGEEILLSDDIDELVGFYIECLGIKQDSVLDELEQELRGKFK
jgi:hypothetical protein